MSIFSSIKREIEKLGGDLKHDLDRVGQEVKKSIEHDAEIAGHAIERGQTRQRPASDEAHRQSRA